MEDYLDDFNDIEEWIFEITGEHTQIFRFPGGSNNSTAKRGIMTDIATEMTRRGYTYYDWNVIAHDDKKRHIPLMFCLTMYQDKWYKKANTIKTMVVHGNESGNIYRYGI